MAMKMWRKPLDWEARAAAPAQIQIIENRCKGCGLCVEFCPRDVLEMSERFNRKGYRPPMVARPLECVGCRFCEEVCPEFAIYCEDADPAQ